MMNVEILMSANGAAVIRAQVALTLMAASDAPVGKI